nr:hypothetical protein [Tanacetum cinerariifolium]
CGSGLSKGLCYICGNNQNSSNDSPSISAKSSQNSPHIDKCCCECGEALDGIFCQQCTCKSCGKEKQIEEEQVANARYWKIPTCCDDDDDSNSAITPVLSTEEPIDSLSMGDEHLDTIPATELDEVIKSSVEDLVPIPSEFEEAIEIVILEEEEIEDDNLQSSSGSTTAHYDISLFEYDSFTFDLANDQFPPTDRSDLTHEEFVDELAHIISPPEGVRQ